MWTGPPITTDLVPSDGLYRGRVLVLDSQPFAARSLEVTLRVEHYEVRCAETCADGVQRLADFRPDLLIASMDLADLRRTELVCHLRRCSAVPILVVGTADDEDGYAEALRAGADDYVATPLRTKEFVARVAALMRRAQGPSDDVVMAGDITIDVRTRDVTVGDRRMRLRPHEFDLLLYLARHPAEVHSHRSLLTTVWGPLVQLRPHYVRMCVAHLRRQIEPTPERPRYLLTERAIGYRLDPGAHLHRNTHRRA